MTLQHDPEIFGAIHAAALKHIAALRTLQTNALITRKLADSFTLILNEVQLCPPRWFSKARRIAADSIELSAAIEAVEWTQHDRGLAGMRSLAGLPWFLRMEVAFEAWVEELVRRIARLSGGVVRTGRLRQTLRPLEWSPPYTGSQRYLLPDVELIRDDETIIFDAKYKSHWEEIDEGRWFGADDAVREAHRSDLHQVLAYSVASDTPRTTCVLLYPCKPETWEQLASRGQLFHRADVSAGSRSVRILLVAAPLTERPETIATELLRGLDAY